MLDADGCARWRGKFLRTRRRVGLRLAPVIWPGRLAGRRCRLFVVGGDRGVLSGHVVDGLSSGGWGKAFNNVYLIFVWCNFW